MPRSSVPFYFFDRPLPPVPIQHGVNALHFRDQRVGNFLVHSHPFVELMCIIDGDISVSVEGDRFKVDPGHVIAVPDGLMHCTIADNPNRPYERLVIHLAKPFLAELHRLFALPPEPFPFLSAPSVIPCRGDHLWVVRSSIQGIFAAFEEPEAMRTAAIRATAMDLLLKLNRIATGGSELPAAHSNRVVAVAIEYINDHYLQPELTVARVAAGVHVSDGHLSRLFKNQTGSSIYAFIIGKRLEHARHLIRGGLPILDAALEAGFSDYTAFIKSFKRHYHTTPSDYRRALEKAYGLA